MSLHLKGWIFSLPIASTYISRAIPYLSNNSSSSPTHTFWAVSPMTVLAHKVFYFDTSSQSKLYGRNHHTIDIVPRVRWWLGLLSYNVWVLWYSFVSPQGREDLEGRKSSNLLYSFQYIICTIDSREKSRFSPFYYSYSKPLREVRCFPRSRCSWSKIWRACLRLPASASLPVVLVLTGGLFDKVSPLLQMDGSPSRTLPIPHM